METDSKKKQGTFSAAKWSKPYSSCLQTKNPENNTKKKKKKKQTLLRDSAKY